jgi:tripeptide aminopeptidase
MLLERFIRYVKIDTQSDDFSDTTPSTSKQFDLLNLLKKELDALKVENELTKTGRLYAFIPGNEKYEAIGVNAHVDTAPDFSGKNVNPEIVKNYDGKRKILGKSGRFLDPEEYPILKKFAGKTMVFTDGTTLLGADDKAGLSIIMESIEILLKLNKNERRPMYILFTPDEETGRGAEEFDTTKFKAKFGYTFDGSSPNLINIENFNAKSAEVNVVGKAIHSGYAKGVMVNASRVIHEFISLLPADMIPEKTEGYEGFNHLDYMSGNVEKAKAGFLLRNHDKNKLEEQAQLFVSIGEKLQKKYPNAKIEVSIKNSYSNMMDVIKQKPECKNYIEEIYKKLNISFKYEPVRGGTDGATFSYKGCPMPNLGTGSYNHHGPYEFLVLEEMEQMVKICTEIFKI